MLRSDGHHIILVGITSTSDISPSLRQMSRSWICHCRIVCICRGSGRVGVPFPLFSNVAIRYFAVCPSIVDTATQSPNPALDSNLSVSWARCDLKSANSGRPSKSLAMSGTSRCVRGAGSEVLGREEDLARCRFRDPLRRWPFFFVFLGEETMSSLSVFPVLLMLGLPEPFDLRRGRLRGFVFGPSPAGRQSRLLYFPAPGTVRPPGRGNRGEMLTAFSSEAFVIHIDMGN